MVLWKIQIKKINPFPVFYDLLSILEPKYYITIMSLISGFPSGSKYTAELLEKKGKYFNLYNSQFVNNI